MYVCVYVHVYIYMHICTHTHICMYMCVCVLIFSVVCMRNQNLPGGMLMTCMSHCHFCFECTSCFDAVVCSAYMCVLFMVFWSDCVFEFFLALFLAEFNPQLSSLANLWNKSELICVTHSLR